MFYIIEYLLVVLVLCLYPSIHPWRFHTGQGYTSCTFNWLINQHHLFSVLTLRKTEMHANKMQWEHSRCTCHGRNVILGLGYIVTDCPRLATLLLSPPHINFRPWFPCCSLYLLLKLILRMVEHSTSQNQKSI